MAVTPVVLYRNTTSIDTTSNSEYQSDQNFPSNSDLSWSFGEQIIAEWNTASDGTGSSFSVGTPIIDAVNATSGVTDYYAIWERHDLTITYKGNDIAVVTGSATKTLLTAGTYCEDDITVSYINPTNLIPVVFRNYSDNIVSVRQVTNTYGVTQSSGLIEMSTVLTIAVNGDGMRFMPYGFGLLVQCQRANNVELRMNNTAISPYLEVARGTSAYCKYYNITRSNLDNSNNTIDFYPSSDPIKEAVVLGTLSATANNTYTAPSGTAYSSVTVNVPPTVPTLQAKTNIDPTTSSQTITADSGYDGLSSVQINAMPSGSATTPATTITANPNISVNLSTGVITATTSASQSVTPTVSAGYVASGTSGTVTVSGSNTSSLTTQEAQTITPTTSDQTIASGKYLTGTQTILGDANLVASNIADGVTIFGITGTHQGGGTPYDGTVEDYVEE